MVILRIFLPLFLLLVGCHKKISHNPGDRQVLRLNMHTEPPTLDARKATDTTSIAIIRMCFEGLMKRVPGMEPQPAIASKVEVSSNQKVYTFTLRPSFWADGTPLTAKDFELSWKRMLNPIFPCGFASDLYILKNGKAAKEGKVSLDSVGVKAINPTTLRVELQFPVPFFLDIVASHSFLPVPSHIAETNQRWADKAGPAFVGNGPFKLTKWRHHNLMILEKNPRYWDEEAVTLDELQVSIIEDETTELHMFEAGDLDWAGKPLSELPPDALQALSDQKRLETYPMSGTYYYIFNVKEPPFDHVKFRKAFTLAIHRQSIIDNIAQSNQEPALSFIPPTMWELSPPLYKDGDIDLAVKYFEEALVETGYTRETLPPITLSYNTVSAHHKIAQAIQEQWYQIFGIRVGLKNKEWKVFLDELAHKQFQIARLGGVASCIDPFAFLENFRYPNSPMNYSGWKNEKFSALLDKVEQTSSLEKREKLLREAERIFLEELPIAPIYFYTGTYIKKPYVNGVKLSELADADYKFAFIEGQ